MVGDIGLLSTARGERLGWRYAAIVVAFGCAVMLPGLDGQSRRFTPHEAFFVQPAREMLAKGDWLVPRIAGDPFTEKGPLTAWVLAGTMAVCGSESEWLLRLPGVCAALGTALLMAFLGARLFGRRVGLVAGLVHMTSWHTLRLGRLAECDIQLAFLVSVAMTCFALSEVPGCTVASGRRWLRVGFFLACGLAFLIKTLIGVALLGAGVLAYLLWSRQWHSWRFFVSPLGWAICLPCLIVWPLLAYQAFPAILDIQLAMYLDRARGSLGGTKPFLFYSYATLWMLLPWTPFVAYGIYQAWREGWLLQPVGRWLLCWPVAGVLLLQLSACKFEHYLGPLLPPCSILAGYGLVAFWSATAVQARSLAWRLTPLPALVFAGGLLWAFLWQPAHPVLTCLLLCVVAASGAWLLHCHARGYYRGWLFGVFAAVGCTFLIVALGVLPKRDPYRQRLDDIARMRGFLQHQQAPKVLNFIDQQLTCYLPPSLETYVRREQLREEFAASTEDLYLLTPLANVPMLQGLGEVEILVRPHPVGSMEEHLTPALLRVRHRPAAQERTEKTS